MHKPKEELKAGADDDDDDEAEPMEDDTHGDDDDDDDDDDDAADDTKGLKAKPRKGKGNSGGFQSMGMEHYQYLHQEHVNNPPCTLVN